jgi:transglutaminase-like putative cysteine protease
VTILNAAGRPYGQLHLAYDKFRKIEELDGELYDARGKRIRSLGDRDQQDFAAIGDEVLYDESRVRTAELFHGEYPYTVAYQYEVSDEAGISWPSWEPEFTRASVEHSVFEVELSGKDTLRWWTNAGLHPHVTRTEDGLLYRWKADHVPALKLEQMGPPAADQYACVKTAPRAFEVEGHPGDLTTWAGFGAWYHGLSVGRQTLSPRTIADVAGRLSGITATRDKVRSLYEYMQDRTRYVNVSLGIGSWQPFPASYVEQRGYGDCKALTNYMSSLLHAAGIESFPVLIHSGAEPRWMAREFPHNCFNHVILCVPVGADTIWLECTSQTAPFGHLGASVENRLGLLVLPDGGTLCRTPASSSRDNCQLRVASVAVTPAANAFATVRTRYTGNQQDRIRSLLETATPREREHWLRDDIGHPNADLRQADFRGVSGRQLSVELSFTAGLRDYCSPAGKRLLFTPNLMERRTYVPPADTLRRQPVIERYAYTDIDSITYLLPPGSHMESLPKPVAVTVPFARYSAEIRVIKPQEVLYVRRLEVIATEVPKGSYADYRAFWSEVVKADKAVASLVFE